MAKIKFVRPNPKANNTSSSSSPPETDNKVSKPKSPRSGRIEKATTTKGYQSPRDRPNNPSGPPSRRARSSGPDRNVQQRPRLPPILTAFIRAVEAEARIRDLRRKVLAAYPSTKCADLLEEFLNRDLSKYECVACSNLIYELREMIEKDRR